MVFIEILVGLIILVLLVVMHELGHATWRGVTVWWLKNLVSAPPAAKNGGLKRAFSARMWCLSKLAAARRVRQAEGRIRFGRRCGDVWRRYLWVKDQDFASRRDDELADGRPAVYDIGVGGDAKILP